MSGAAPEGARPALHSAIPDGDAPEEVAARVFHDTISSLDRAWHARDREPVDAAADPILEATHLEVFGFGASAIVARDMQQKFPLFGIP